MKKIYALCLSIFVLYSCSKNEPTPDDAIGPDGVTGSETDPKAALEACFTLDKTSALIGEYIQITSCSKGVESYLYDFGNGNTSVKENPKILLEVSGDFDIVLTVTDKEQNTEIFSKSITVTAPVEINYIFPELGIGFSGFPLETGITPDSKIYYLNLIEDQVSIGGSKFYYEELNENYDVTSQYIMDKQFNTQSAFINFLVNGNRNLHFSRTLADFYGTHEITFNNGWDFINGLNSSTKHNYGYILDGADFLYYGTEKEDALYKTVIERRNANGDTFEIFLNVFGDTDAMIGDMIAVTNGYVAFGGVFTKNVTSPQVTGYKPLLVFFDTALNASSHVIFENSVLDSKISSINDLNGAYHLEELSNGNFALYANGELIVANVSGVEITTTYFEETANNQALFSLDNAFIISTNNYLRKFDANGNQIKELKYNGNYMPEIIETNNQLFFVAGYDTMEDEINLVKLFYGAMDNDMNLINLN
ncbi:MAG: hypothetical protein COA50_00090 [Flavobacteriaceae bacterium]|nr:MAG: hypothetical protein COA50_00090 [Flavobacteriaceae bacterium]